MVSNVLNELRASKTMLALAFAALSIVYTYIEVRSSKELKRTIIGIYLRNFTFSFIIVYLGLLAYSPNGGASVKVGGSSVGGGAILTGRPNF